MEEEYEKEVVQSTYHNKSPHEKDEYSIANYLKEHHGLLIATTSAIVAIFSFVINIVNYLNVNAYLTFWDVEISQVTLNSSNQIYSVFTAFFFQFIVFFLTWFISNTYDSYEERLEILLYGKWRQKEVSKRIRKVNKELNVSEKELKKLKRTSDDTEEIEKIIDSVKKELAKYKQEVKEIKKDILKSIRQEMFLLLISNVIAFAIVFLGCTILFTALIYCDNVFQYSLIFGLFFVSINVLIHGGINYLVARRKMKTVDSKELEEIRYKDLPIEKVILGKWNLIVSNKSIKGIFIQLFVLTIIFIFSFSYAGYSRAREQRDFQYVTSEDETYVVIFNNSEELVIKKAFIDTDDIVIDLSVQKAISAEDVTLFKKRFSKVEVLRVQ